MTKDLWRVVEQKLRYHRKATDATGLDALNRVFEKVLKRTGGIEEPPRLSPETCSIRLEQWPTNRLSRELIRTHCRASPLSEDAPLISVEYDGRTFAVDGATRANKWISENRPGLHAIIIVSREPDAPVS